MTPRKKKAVKKGTGGLELVIGAMILCVLATAYYVVNKKQAPPPVRATASTFAPLPPVATFSFERTSDLGDRVQYQIECPGTQLCIIEISENGQTIAKAEAPWDLLSSFFVHYSGSPLILKPVKAATAPTRELVRFKFQMGSVSSEGVITDQSEYRALIPYWDALILSFI